jgi:hypothetical protein
MNFGITACDEFFETPQRFDWLIRCLSLLNYSKIGYLKFNEQNNKDIEAKWSSFSIRDAVIITQESMKELEMEGRLPLWGLHAKRSKNLPKVACYSLFFMGESSNDF